MDFTAAVYCDVLLDDFRLRMGRRGLATRMLASCVTVAVAI